MTASEDTADIPEFLQRMIVEQQELDGRKDRLSAFIESKTFDGLEEHMQTLMRVQFHHMAQYSNVLGERIKIIRNGG